MGAMKSTNNRFVYDGILKEYLKAGCETGKNVRARFKKGARREY